MRVLREGVAWSGCLEGIVGYWDECVSFAMKGSGSMRMRLDMSLSYYVGGLRGRVVTGE